MKNRFVPGLVDGADEFLIKHLRPHDIQEAWALAHQTPREVVLKSIELSTMLWTVMVDDQPAGLCGCAPNEHAPQIGIPWALGTDALHGARVFFYRQSEVCVQAMLMRWDHLINFVDARNHLSLRWLRFLKFETHPAVEMGPEKQLFHRVERRL